MSSSGSAPSISSVSVCSSEHFDVWCLTSRLLPEFVAADEFIVYVPAADIKRFEGATPSIFSIRSQESIASGFDDELLTAVQEAGNLKRHGWYRQQLIKIKALSQAVGQLSVLWDADCVPLQPITLFDEHWRPQYIGSSEFHGPYFESAERLLGLSRIQHHSFIAPAFPIPSSWAAEFITSVEQHSAGLRWPSAVIACADLSLESGFSEFETLGTWVSHVHNGEFSVRTMAWERLGRSRFGDPRQLSVSDLIDIGSRIGLDIVSFENWDRPSIRTWLRHRRNRFLEFVGRDPYT